MRASFRRVGIHLVSWEILLAIGVLACGMTAHALVIIPNWDCSITNDPNAAVIEGTINTALQYYQTRFADPITVIITFEEITNTDDVGQSSWYYYDVAYPDYLAALQSHATTPNDSLALTQFPNTATNPVTGSGYVRVKTANLHVLGFTNFGSALPGGVDGIIGLNTSQMNLSRATNNGTNYDLLTIVDHEIDEVLGLGSALDSDGSDPFPEDFFRYSSDMSRSFTTDGDDAFFSLDGTNLLARFNQDPDGDYGDWWSAGDVYWTNTPFAQVQDAFATPGATPQPTLELIALDVIGYTLLPPPQPVITGISACASSTVINVTNGEPSGTCITLASGDFSLPVYLWTPVATNFLNGANVSITLSNGVNPACSNQFFTLELEP